MGESAQFGWILRALDFSGSDLQGRWKIKGFDSSINFKASENAGGASGYGY